MHSPLLRRHACLALGSMLAAFTLAGSNEMMNDSCVQLCRSAGKSVEWDVGHHTVQELTEGSFGDVDIALFSAGGSISKQFAPVASDAGCTV